MSLRFLGNTWLKKDGFFSERFELELLSKSNFKSACKKSLKQRDNSEENREKTVKELKNEDPENELESESFFSFESDLDLDDSDWGFEKDSKWNWDELEEWDFETEWNWDELEDSELEIDWGWDEPLD